jgi:ferredoxin
MSTYRIVIDQSLCSGFGSCVEAARSAFRLNGGTATALVTETDDPAVLDAAAGCPMGAIAILDAATEEQVG